MSVYLKAAKRLDSGIYTEWKDYYICSGCCDYIEWAGGNSIRFAILFRPNYANSNYWGKQWSDDTKKQKKCRVLALLFAHAMYEADDL